MKLDLQGGATVYGLFGCVLLSSSWTTEGSFVSPRRACAHPRLLRRGRRNSNSNTAAFVSTRSTRHDQGLEQSSEAAVAAGIVVAPPPYDPAEDFEEEPSAAELSIAQLQEPQAWDICCDLQGRPLSPQYFADALSEHVSSYACPESEAFRGLMSHACRVYLQPSGRSVFYKRIVFDSLEHCHEKLRQAPHKLRRDAVSCQVVANFLVSKACRQLVATTGVGIPHCYDAQQCASKDDPMESKFSFLFQDLTPADGWYQLWLLQDRQECQASLSTLAKVHAFFWEGSSFWNHNNADAASEFEAGVWKSGSYIQPEAQSPDQWKSVAQEWKIKRMKFKNELSSLPFWDNLGERLQSVAEDCGRHAHPFVDDEFVEQYSYRQFRTFTHGDPKQANLLFRNDGGQVGLVDFQWAGFGLAATDVAHFLTSAVHADQLNHGGEERLLRYYFDELQNYLVQYGADDSILSYDTFLHQYETAVLDVGRLVIAYTWSRFDEAVTPDDPEGCARTMNKTSYNKSVPNVIWFLTKCHDILTSRGV